jgi:AcrR family transcriptional regulator
MSGLETPARSAPEPAGETSVDRMDALFEQQGFAATSVDDLRDAAGVSLRTLYRRYGSREQMIVAVLRNRAEKYLAHLAGSGGVRQLFERTEQWMKMSHSQLGCLFLRARADHPGHPAIEQATADYHTALHSRLTAAAEADGLDDAAVKELFVLHEGLIAAVPAVGVDAAVRATRSALERLLLPTDPSKAKAS